MGRTPAKSAKFKSRWNLLLHWNLLFQVSHGTALSTILNFYDSNFGCEDFLRIIDWMPYIIELDFEGNELVGKQEYCHVEKEFKARR